jgi:glycosyltransferase involved in cell wall biosynthesis
LRVWVIEVERPGHAYGHAKSLADEISGQADVCLVLLKSPLSLEELMQSAATSRVDVVVMATLDTYFLKGLFKGPRCTTHPRLVGVLHDTRQLDSWVRRLIWKSLSLLGQIDRVLIYSGKNINGIMSEGLMCSVRHPVGEIKPLGYNKKKKILFFGILSEEKGAERLQVIAENLPSGYILHVAGTCSDKSLEGRLTESWKTLIAIGRIKWSKGEINEQIKLEYFRESVCLLAPYQSKHGRASGIAIDALKYNIPILYFVEHCWMSDLFTGLNWPGAIPLRNFVVETVGLELEKSLRLADDFRSHPSEMEFRNNYNYIKAII